MLHHDDNVLPESGEIIKESDHSVAVHKGSPNDDAVCPQTQHRVDDHRPSPFAIRSRNHKLQRVPQEEPKSEWKHDVRVRIGSGVIIIGHRIVQRVHEYHRVR